VNTPEELFIPRVWHGTHAEGIPGYEVDVSPEISISIGIQSSERVSVFLQRTAIDENNEPIELPNLTYWADSMKDALQWIANTLQIPVMIDEEEAVYPENAFDDGDDGDFEEEDFDDGDDGELDEDDEEESDKKVANGEQ